VTIENHTPAWPGSPPGRQHEMAGRPRGGEALKADSPSGAQATPGFEPGTGRLPAVARRNNPPHHSLTDGNSLYYIIWPMGNSFWQLPGVDRDEEILNG